MSIIFNSLYRKVKDGTLQVMPAPVDKDTPDAPWWFDKVAAMAAELAGYGFTAILWPPVQKTQGGSANNADGYGKQFDYDIGRWNPRYKRWESTRWGNDEQARRAFSAVHAAGLSNYLDIVIHQYDGGVNGVYLSPGADGTSKNGRFPKTPSCFVGAAPRVAADPIFDTEGNAAFGDMCSFINSTPKGYMLAGMIESLQHLLLSLDADGGRLDDVKGENAAVMYRIVTASTLRNAYTFGECFVGDAGELGAWVAALRGKCGALDFPLHWTLRAIADEGASCRILQGAGLVGRDPMHAVTFLDTADTDGNDDENIKTNKKALYALLLTMPGTPMVYSRDYLPECYGLKSAIDNLAWIATMFAVGGDEVRWVDDRAYAFTRDGNGGKYGWSGGLLTAVNFDTANGRRIVCATHFQPHTELQDYTGHLGNIWTDANGWVDFWLPANVGNAGDAYACFATAGVSRSHSPKPLGVAQTMFGAGDLDIDGLKPLYRLPSRIYCAKGTILRLDLTVGMLAENPYAAIRLTVDGPVGRVGYAGMTGAQATAHIGIVVPVEGWHAITVDADAAYAGKPFSLQCSYMGVAK